MRYFFLQGELTLRENKPDTRIIVIFVHSYIPSFSKSAGHIVGTQ